MRAHDLEPHSLPLQGLAWKTDARISRESTRWIDGQMGQGRVSWHQINTLVRL